MPRAQSNTELSPLTGLLDLRSPPDALPAGAMRWRLNWRCVDQNKLRRAQGFEKLLTENSPYNNEDLHDQLLFLTNQTDRQPITLLYEAESSRKQKSLLAATESTIYKLNNTSGNWAVLATGFGKGDNTAQGPRFKAARQGDYVIFTNDYNAPRYHILEQGYPDVPPMVQEIPDLEVIGLTKARLVFVYQQVVFFADVEMDQQRFPFRLVWGDFDNPTSFDPFKAESIAGSKDLDPNEQILGAAPMGNDFIIYTTHNIWVLTAVGGEESFAFRKAYQGDRSNFVGVLKFPNSLIHAGDYHIYIGDCGTDDSSSKSAKVFTFNPYQQSPQCPEWLHRATKKMIDEIDPMACDAHHGWMNGNEVYLSYATTAATDFCPNWTFRFNKEYNVADYMDHGFTAFCEFTPGSSPTIRDFILQYQICTADELFFQGLLFGLEGMPREFPPTPSGPVPASIYTLDPLHMFGSITVDAAGSTNANGTYFWEDAGERYVKSNGYYMKRENGATATWRLYTDLDDILYSNPVTIEASPWATIVDGVAPAPNVTPDASAVVVEDYFKPTADPDSLCAILCEGCDDPTTEATTNGLRFDDICKVCPQPRIFVAASSEDWSLKQMNTDMFREICNNPEAPGTSVTYGYQSSIGEYDQDGYDSILRFAPLYNKDGDVILEGFQVNYIVQPQDPPPSCKLRVGISAQPADPNTDYCGLVWHQRSTKDLKCLTPRTAEEHRTGNTQPYEVLGWNFWHTGHYIYVEFKIEGTGADAEFSGVAGGASLKEVINAT